LLAVGDERQHAGNEGYDDTPETHYSWDSTVPHHADVSRGDVIAIWDKQQLLGASVIEDIEVGESTKWLYSCPNCGKASIKARKTLEPRYLCSGCHSTFDEPARRQVRVTTYRSRHDIGWTELIGGLSGPELRSLCESTNSQQSLRPLRWTDFVDSLDRYPAFGRLTVVDARADQLSGGHRTVTVRVRLGQAAFRRRLIEQFGAVCAFTGPAPLSVLDACHLYSYATNGTHHAHGGLLLRRDIHRLFDAGHLAVHPTAAVIDVEPAIAVFPAYAGLNGVGLRVSVAGGQQAWLRSHWREHRPTA
jgi:hypothetical protein